MCPLGPWITLVTYMGTSAFADTLPGLELDQMTVRRSLGRRLRGLFRYNPVIIPVDIPV